MPAACPPGKIRRVASRVRAYSRKGYTRSDGTRVKAASVRSLRRGSACVPDKGKPGRTPKSQRVLPKIGKPGLLRNQGYDTDKPAAARQVSLLKAANQKGETVLSVLRHLNLARNYQADAKAKAAMSADIKFLSAELRRSKSGGSRKSSRKGSRKGSSKSSRNGSKKSRKSRSRKGSKKMAKKW